MGTIHRLSFLLLLWNISLNFVGTSAVVAKSLQRSASIVDAQDQLLRAQIEINSISTTDSLEEIKDRLSSLEEELKKLNELSDLRQALENKSSDIMLALQMLTKQYSSIDSQLKALQISVNERAQSEDERRALKEVADAVKGSNFKLANEKLIQSANMLTLIPKIVHEVYGVDTVDILVNFSKALSKITPSYEVLKSLYEEMKTNDHQDANKLIIIAEALQSEVISQQNDPEGIKVNAGAIIDELVDAVRVTATKFFVEAMNKSCDYRTRADIHTLAGALHVFRPDVSDEVMQALVDEIYGIVPADTILDNFSSHSITAQAISGVNALFWKLKNDGKVNSATVLNLASSLSKLQNRNDIDSLSDERKDLVEKVIDNIPTCARNLFFNSTAVCLWNKARDTYLIAAESIFNYDKQRRNIFTYSPPFDTRISIPEEIPHEAAWIPEKINDKILFKSVAYPNEYLYAAAIDYNQEMRYVFNWISGHNTDDQSAFNVELKDDHCHLKSMYFDEYLFASEVKYKRDENYSYVFTWKPGTSGGNTDFVWQIRSC